MSSLNKVCLLGNVGKDPEARAMNNGGEVVSFSLATSDTWTRDGQKQERTEWHNIVIFNDHIAKVAKQYLRKGSKVYLEGALQTRKWQDQNGNDRYTTEVVLQKFRGELVLLSGKEDKPAGNDRGASSSSGSAWDDADDSVPF